MAKAILEYNLADPDDSHYHKLAVKSSDLIVSLWEIDQYLRSRLKYEDSLSEEQYSVLEETRDRLYSILSENGISFDELIR